jgi:hypothetical protein
MSEAVLDSKLVIAIGSLLERRASATGIAALSERKDLEPVSVAALGAVYPDVPSGTGR